MVFHWVNESYGLAGLYLMLSLFGVCLYAILAGGSYLVFFVLRRERHHPGLSPDSNELRRSVLWSLYSVSGNALLMLPIEVLILSGASEIYFSVAEHGWPYLFGSIFAVLAVAETSSYGSTAPCIPVFSTGTCTSSTTGFESPRRWPAWRFIRSIRLHRPCLIISVRSCCSCTCGYTTASLPW